MQADKQGLQRRDGGCGVFSKYDYLYYSFHIFVFLMSYQSYLDVVETPRKCYLSRMFHIYFNFKMWNS